MSAEAMRQALLEKRAAENGTTLESNVDQGNDGVNNVYPNPEGRPSGTLSAPWGEKPHPDPFHHSTSVWEQAQEDRPKMLGRLFDVLEPSAAADKKLVSDNFETNTYESHSPLLQKKASHESPPTLGERVRSLLSRG